MDLKAKAPVQCFTECNGFYGCSFCIQKGLSTGTYSHIDNFILYRWNK